MHFSLARSHTRLLNCAVEMDTLQELNEPKYTPEEIGEIYKLHPSTVRKRFVDEPGVIRMGHPGSQRRRQHFTLRIPASVVARVFGKMTVKG